METHVTEQQLIDWLFDLAEPEAAEQIAAHVARCPACQQAKEQLQQRFASLDLLQNDPEISEDLIQRVTAQVSAPRKRVLWPWWLGVAATVVAGLLVTQLQPQNHNQPKFYDEVAITEIAPQQPAPSHMNKIPAEPKAQDSILAEPEDPFARRPFAPASAIELVTLPQRENVQLTIYNAEDLTLVRETRHLTLKRGWNWLQFMWADTFIDPTSLELEPQAQQDQITVEQLVYPAGLRDIGRWLIRSEVEGQFPFELTYFTSGLTWRAFYMGTLSLDETTMSLKSYVRVDNQSGEDFEEAQTRLVLGEINLVDQITQLANQPYPFGRPNQEVANQSDWYFYDSDTDETNTTIDLCCLEPISSESMLLNEKLILKKNLSEYILYTIEGTEDLTNQWGKRLLSLEAQDIPVTSLYQYDESRWGNRAQRFVSFANDSEHKLGQTPLPQGNLKLYAQADDGLVFLGDSEFKYIPVNEDVELHLGPARYVQVEPVRMQQETTNYRFDDDGNVTGFDRIEHWQIKVTNTRDLPIEIKITRDFGTSYWTLNGTKYEKYDAQQAQFKQTVESESELTINYRLTTYQGVRAEENQQLTTRNQQPK